MLMRTNAGSLRQLSRVLYLSNVYVRIIFSQRLDTLAAYPARPQPARLCGAESRQRVALLSASGWQLALRPVRSQHVIRGSDKLVSSSSSSVFLELIEERALSQRARASCHLG